MPAIRPTASPRYTSNITLADGWWLCTDCHRPYEESTKSSLKYRGYKNIPFSLANRLPEPYNLWPTDLYFANPPCVDSCQNAWKAGLGGIHCRGKAAGYNKDLSVQQDRARGLYFMYCSLCAMPKVDFDIIIASEHLNTTKVGKRAEHILMEMDITNVPLNMEAYAAVELASSQFNEQKKLFRAAWGKDAICKPILYDGTPDSLKCTTTKWGVDALGMGGLRTGDTISTPSEDMACSGHYGGPSYMAYLTDGCATRNWFDERHPMFRRLDWYVKKVKR